MILWKDGDVAGAAMNVSRKALAWRATSASG